MVRIVRPVGPGRAAQPILVRKSGVRELWPRIPGSRPPAATRISPYAGSSPGPAADSIRTERPGASCRAEVAAAPPGPPGEVCAPIIWHVKRPGQLCERDRGPSPGEQERSSRPTLNPARSIAAEVAAAERVQLRHRCLRWLVIPASSPARPRRPSRENEPGSRCHWAISRTGPAVNSCSLPGFPGRPAVTAIRRSAHSDRAHIPAARNDPPLPTATIWLWPWPTPWLPDRRGLGSCQVRREAWSTKVHASRTRGRRILMITDSAPADSSPGRAWYPEPSQKRAERCSAWTG